MHWALHARSGLTTHQVLRAAARAMTPPPADVAVVVTGVNDVIDQVPARRAVQQRAALADWLLAEGRAGARGVCAAATGAPLPAAAASRCAA